MLRHVQPLTTPLLRQMATFAKWLTIASGVIATITFAYGVWLRDYPAGEMFLADVGLAVAGIPEELR
jgi:magnesium-transporting ATPase (P-type)